MSIVGIPSSTDIEAATSISGSCYRHDGTYIQQATNSAMSNDQLKQKYPVIFVRIELKVGGIGI